VHIEGSGGRKAGAGSTLLTAQDGTNSQTVLKVLAPGSTISGLSVRLPTGSSEKGIHTNGAISNVLVYASEGTSVSSGVTLEADGALADSDVLMPIGDSGSGTAVVVTGSGTTVTDVRIEGNAAYVINVASGPEGFVRRVRAEFANVAFLVINGSVSVEDSLLVTRVDNDIAHNGILVSPSASVGSLTANHVTMIGPFDDTTTALKATASNAAHNASITFRNGIVMGFPIMFNRTATAGTANISTDYSNYNGRTATPSGTGAITETNHLDLDPRFVAANDFRLRADSPLLDVGDPAGLAAGESPTDVSGQPRISDAEGDCAVRRDIGAFEYTAGPRFPRAVATATPTASVPGQQVAFEATASCDPDGDALSYEWVFDDGATASGPSVQHPFGSAGRHFGTVTVTDATGRASIATAVVTTTALPRPFAGVTVGKQTVRVSRKGVAKVKVKCPKAARGSCAGTLRLTARLRKRATIGSKRFSIKAGATRAVSVKLSKRARARLRRNGRLNAVATGTAKDASGLTKVGTGTLVLTAR
jgi:hypothetical protein